jgi:hypothetical protein
MVEAGNFKDADDGSKDLEKLMELVKCCVDRYVDELKQAQIFQHMLRHFAQTLCSIEDLLLEQIEA